MALYLPKGITPRKEHVARMCEHFQKTLETKVLANQHKQQPYWVVYKLTCNKLVQGRPFEQYCFVSEVDPPKMNGAICYKIDNSAGTKELAWVVEA